MRRRRVPDVDLSEEDKSVTFKRMVPTRRRCIPFLPRHVLEKDKK